MIEHLVVDLGGVAAEFRPQARLRALAETTGLETDLVHRRLFTSGLDREAELGQIDPDETVDRVLQALENRLVRTDLVDCWAVAFVPDEDFLAALHELPLRRTLLTNNGPLITACLAGPLSTIATAFDEVICSWQIRACKPDPVAFARTVEHQGATPEQMLLLDDDSHNVMAAKECGWYGEIVTSRQAALDVIVGCRGLGTPMIG